MCVNKVIKEDLRIPSFISLYVAKGERGEDHREWAAINRLFISHNTSPAETKWRFTPLVWNKRQFNRKTLDEPGTQTLHRNVVFPLTYYERRDGQLEMSLLDPLSLLNDEKDLTRHCSGLLHLLDYKQRDDGSHETRLRWRAWHHSVEEQRSVTEMYPFVYNESANNDHYFSVGWKLLEYARTGERRQVKILGFPLLHQ